MPTSGINVSSGASLTVAPVNGSVAVLVIAADNGHGKTNCRPDKASTCTMAWLLSSVKHLLSSCEVTCNQCEWHQQQLSKNQLQLPCCSFAVHANCKQLLQDTGLNSRDTPATSAHCSHMCCCTVQWSTPTHLLAHQCTGGDTNWRSLSCVQCFPLTNVATSWVWCNAK